MRFLAPEQGLIAAAVAVPILLALYFLKLRRRVLRVSAVMLWQQAVKDMQVNVPFRWLRFNWLLLLQLLALASLLFAAARPVINTGGPGTARMVIVIDASASMGAMDGDRRYRDRASVAPTDAAISRLQEAKGRALEIIDTIDGAADRQAMVVRFAGDASALTPMTADATALREAVASVTQTDQPGDPLEAMRLVRTFVRFTTDETADTPPTDVLLLSDGGTPEYPDTDAHNRDVAATLAGVRASLVRCGPSPTGSGIANVGIASLNARREQDDPATVRMFARVVNASIRTTDVQVVFSYDGIEKERRLVSVPGAKYRVTSAATGVSVSGEAPNDSPVGKANVGEAGVSFSLNSSAGGVAQVSIVTPDLLACDNAAAAIVRPSRSPSVVVVSPSGTADADPFLLAALEAHRVTKLDVIDAQRYAAEISPPGGGLGATIAGADLILFDRVAAGVLPQTPSVHFGASFTVGRGESAAAVQLKPPATGGVEPINLLSFNREHPMLRYAGLETLLIEGAWTFTLPADAALTRASCSLAPIAGIPSGTVMLAIRDASGSPAVGRAAVAFPIAKSNWGSHHSFYMFIGNALDALAGAGEARAGIAARTDQPIAVRPAPGVNEVAANGPSGAIVKATVPKDAADPVSLGLLPRVGVYTVSGVIANDRLVAANLVNEGETSCTTHDTLTLARQMPLPPKVKPDESAGGREIWRWFLTAAAGLLTLEWFLYAWLMKA